MRIYAYMCVHMRIYAYMCVYMLICAYICVYMLICAYICVYMLICAYICVQCTRIGIHMQTCMHVRMRAYIYVYIHIYIYVYIYIYIYIYIYTHRYYSHPIREYGMRLSFSCFFKINFLQIWPSVKTSRHELRSGTRFLRLHSLENCSNASGWFFTISAMRQFWKFFQFFVDLLWRYAHANATLIPSGS
jgi:hypothetical protein